MPTRRKDIDGGLMARILVVDDDDDITLTVVSKTLIKAGHQVKTAKDGHIALEMCERERFDLIISDATMPGGISGFNLVLTLRKLERYKETPIMFLTGRREKHAVVHAIQSGADDYVVKPIEPEMFLDKISHLLSGKAFSAAFKKIPLQERAEWIIDTTITGISEDGVSGQSVQALVPGSRLQLRSAVFDRAGISTPVLRVLNCHQAEPADRPWHFNAVFVGLSEADARALKSWLDIQAPPAAKKA